MRHILNKRWVRQIFGWAFMVLGVLGLFLPILQGVLFLAIGLTILSKDSPWAQRLIARARARYPQHAATLDEATHRAAQFFRKLGGRERRAAHKSDTPPGAP